MSANVRAGRDCACRVGGTGTGEGSAKLQKSDDWDSYSNASVARPAFRPQRFDDDVINKFCVGSLLSPPRLVQYSQTRRVDWKQTTRANCQTIYKGKGKAYLPTNYGNAVQCRAVQNGSFFLPSEASAVSSRQGSASSNSAYSTRTVEFAHSNSFVHSHSPLHCCAAPT